jgi:hypothetical protein
MTRMQPTIPLPRRQFCLRPVCGDIDSVIRMARNFAA